MRDFNVIERGENYFRCQVDGKALRHCRIIIDEFSQDLPLGKIRLHVEEISDRNLHFANDAVFRLTLPLAEQHSIDICTLKPGKMNRFTYKECVRLSGKWEPILNEWVFSASVQDQVENLRKIVHSPRVNVEVTFRETISTPNKSLSLFGFELIKGTRLNRTPVLHKGITLKKGDITYMVSPMPKSVVIADSVIRLPVPKLMLDSSLFKEDYFAALDIKLARGRSPKQY